MKKIINKLPSIIVLFLIFMLTACADREIQQLRKDHSLLIVAFVVDGTMNGMSPESYISFIPPDIMNRAVAENSIYAIVAVSQSPQLFRTIIPRFSAVNGSQWREDHASYLNQLRTDIREKSKPQEEGLDLLQAISIATDFINAAARNFDDEVEKVMVIISSFLTVDGEFAFDNNNIHAYFAGERDLINSRMDFTADFLFENNIIGDLTGITVVTAGIGNTSLPQESLSSNQRALLRLFWDKIFHVANAQEVIHISGQTGVSSSSTLPVATLNFPKEESITFPSGTTGEGEGNGGGGGGSPPPPPPIWFLDERKVRFIPDTSTYDDEEEVIAELIPIVEYLLAEQNLDVTLLLAGGTAGDTDTEYSIELSLARANAVKATLELLGVPTHRLQTIGLGSNNRWHVRGLALSDPLSQMNRQVVVLRADSEAAIEILTNAGYFE
jgi:outer membrane protein OmpA-like peptidoglycan-associated protein